MAVTNTPNINLAKPDDTEFAKNWAVTFPLAKNNNDIITDQMDIPVTPYAAVLVSSGTTPNVGVGSVVAEYQEFPGGIIFGSFRVTFADPGVAAGTGVYLVSLPAVVDPVFHTVVGTATAVPNGTSVVGEGYIYDLSAPTTTSMSVVLDVATFGGVSYVRMLTEAYTTPTKTNTVVTSGIPFTVASGDNFGCTFFYKKQ